MKSCQQGEFLQSAQLYNPLIIIDIYNKASILIVWHIRLTQTRINSWLSFIERDAKCITWCVGWKPQTWQSTAFSIMFTRTDVTRSQSPRVDFLIFMLPRNLFSTTRLGAVFLGRFLLVKTDFSARCTDNQVSHGRREFFYIKWSWSGSLFRKTLFALLYSDRQRIVYVHYKWTKQILHCSQANHIVAVKPLNWFSSLLLSVVISAHSHVTLLCPSHLQSASIGLLIHHWNAATPFISTISVWILPYRTSRSLVQSPKTQHDSKIMHAVCNALLLNSNEVSPDWNNSILIQTDIKTNTTYPKV